MCGTPYSTVNVWNSVLDHKYVELDQMFDTVHNPRIEICLYIIARYVSILVVPRNRHG